MPSKNSEMAVKVKKIKRNTSHGHSIKHIVFFIPKRMEQYEAGDDKDLSITPCMEPQVPK
jgi:hypothetical protein